MANEYQGARVPSYRNLNTLYRAIFRSDKMHPVVLLTGNFESSTLRLWSGYDTLTYDGEEFVGAGNLIGISPLTETSEIRANGVTVSLSGISSSIISLALSENLNGRTITIDLGFIAGDSDEIVTYATKVRQWGASKKFIIEEDKAGTIFVKEGDTFRFDQSNFSSTNHNLRISTTADGTHGGGAQYSTGWTETGTAGSSGAYNQWVVGTGLNSTMYYYDQNTSGMGGTITVMTDYILPTPYTFFSGLMDKMTIQDSGETTNITLNCENYLVRLEQQKIRRYTPEDQKLEYPNDKGLDFVAAIQEKEIAWGMDN